MKIYLNRKPSNDTSINIVAKNLTTYFSSYGVEWTTNKNDKWDVELAFMYERDMRLFKKSVVQRIDGIYLDSSIDCRTANAPIISTYNKAKGVIFQSKFSYDMITKNFGQPKGKHTIIYNGAIIDEIDAKSYLMGKYPQFSNILDGSNEILVCAAQWRRVKRLTSIITGTLEYMRSKKNVYLFILGEIDKYEKQNIIKNEHFIYLDRISNEDVRQFVKVANVCINLSIVDACPNIVIEALSNGTACLVSRHQGCVEIMKEDDGVILPDFKWDNFAPFDFKYAPQIDPVVVANGIERCVKMGRHKVREDLDMKNITKKYADFLKGI